MNKTTQSLTAIALHKFKRNLYVLVWVCLDYAFHFYFAYVLAPDKSENANQMHLSIHSKPPGFQVDILSIPLDRKPYKSLSNYFIGFPNTVTERLQLKVIKSLAVL
jgi:peptide/nickel transport system permease protein